MNVRNEPLYDMANVVKRETPPAWRWKLGEFQHGKRIQFRELIWLDGGGERTGLIIWWGKCWHHFFKGKLRAKKLGKLALFEKLRSCRREEARLVGGRRKEFPANHITWINLVLNHVMHCANCGIRWAQESYIYTSTTQVTTPGLSLNSKLANGNAIVTGKRLFLK